MSRYNPVCETCNARPKMDRCDCCEECWYSGRYSREQAMRTMAPGERRRFEAEQRVRHFYDGWAS